MQLLFGRRRSRPSPRRLRTCPLWRCWASLLAAGLAGSAAEAYDAIDLSGFRDGAQHWQREFGRDRDDPRFRSNQIVEIADNMLAYQLPDGGWPKNLDPLVATPKQQLAELLGRSLQRSTLDNRNTYTQIEYLAKVYQVTNLARYRMAAERGIDFVLREQRPSGGWRGADVDAITYNDDVMLGVMRLLRDIEAKASHFVWVDDSRRQAAEAALQRAIEATLRCQIVVQGKKTAWCQQHDHATFAPVRARTYELPAICPIESAGIVHFLMGIADHPPEVVAAIDAAVAWIEAVQIDGIRVERKPVTLVRYKHHSIRYDVVAVADPAAPPIWARYYEIETNRPFFCNRDGVKVYRLEEVEQERRTGYGWYSSAPAKLVEIDYPAWKKAIATHRTKTIESNTISASGPR